MSDLIPFVHDQEVAQIRQEIARKKVSAMFDDTTRLGEAIVIVIHFVADNCQIQHCLVHLQLLVKLLTSEEISRKIIAVLQVDYGVVVRPLLGCTRDRASVNNVAKVMFLDVLMLDAFPTLWIMLGSISHPPWDEFVAAWIVLFSHSPKAHLAWSAQTGKAQKSLFKMRW